MFGLRRKTRAASVDWTALLSLLEDDDRRAALEQIAPTAGRESFLAALRRMQPDLAEKVLAAGRQTHTASQLIERPTVAVAGMLNSGKTSLVDTFLSEAGRERSLRGVTNREGTHRFVLWLPQAWKADVELWGLLINRIGDALGRPPEMLSESPATAHAQYNNREGDAEKLGVPLLATDSGLDAAGIGLLDCPDVVSDEAFGLGSPQARRALLGRAATLCSAFLVVTSAESSRDAMLGDLLRVASDLMPGVPRFLAVNKIRPQQTPDRVYETFTPLAKTYGVETIFAAYDFDIPSSGPYIPDGPRRSATSAAGRPDATSSGDGDPPLPVFFALSSDADANPPAAIGADRLLSSLPERLDRAELFERFQRALESGLRNAVWEEAFKRVSDEADESRRKSQIASECLLHAAFDFFAHRSIGGEVTELRLHQSERIVRQLSESFASTAPWYARWGVRLNTTVRRIFGGATDLVRQLTPTALAQRTANELKDKFRQGEYGGLMTPDRLSNAIDRHGGTDLLIHWPENGPWGEAVESSISRFERDDFTSLDPRRLDEAVRQMWREVPVRKKMTAGLTPLLAMLATFGAVLMIPMDFGGSLVLYSASIPELLTAAGLTTLSAMWAGGKSTQNVGQQAARQQLADFHAVLCDTFGLRRPEQALVVTVANQPETLPSPQIIRRDPVGPSLAVYRVRDEFQQELQRHLPRSGPPTS